MVATRQKMSRYVSSAADNIYQGNPPQKSGNSILANTALATKPNDIASFPIFFSLRTQRQALMCILSCVSAGAGKLLHVVELNPARPECIGRRYASQFKRP